MAVGGYASNRRLADAGDLQGQCQFGFAFADHHRNGATPRYGFLSCSGIS